MPAVARSRSFDDRVGHIGSYWTSIGPTTFYNGSSIGDFGTCDDVVGNYPAPNDLKITRIHHAHPELDGELYSSGGALIRKFSAYPCDRDPSIPSPATKFPVMTSLLKNNLAWEILSNTNVSQPSVNIPTFAAELRDIPSMIYWWGKNIFRNVASANLTVKWGYRPLISDVLKLLQFQKLYNKKLAELEHLRDKRSIRKRTFLSKGRLVEGPTRLFINSQGVSIQADRTVVHSYRMWGSVNYKLQSDFVFPEKASDEMMYFTRRLLFGHNARGLLETAWELIPWSWLIDWFTGFGDVISATNNTIPTTWSNICIMRTMRSDAYYSIVPGAWQSWVRLNGVPSENHVIKERFTAFPVLPFSPSLRRLSDVDAWSVLASLAVLKAPRRFTQPFG